MTLTKKVLLLTILLIALIVACVYQHTKEFIPTEPQIEDTTTLNAPQETLPTEDEKEAAQVVEEKIKEFDNNESTSKEIAEEMKTVAQPTFAPAPITPTVPAKTKANIQDEINTVISNNAIVFQRMSYNVTEKSKDVLVQVAKVLNDNKDIKIEIAGHTDAKGDESFNQLVSQQRADSVKNILVEMGVEASRMRAVGYGETKPIVPNDAEGYSTVNRRVEFNIIEE